MESNIDNRSLSIAILQMHVQAGDPEANFAKVDTMMNEALTDGAKPDVIVLPEMWNTGYALDRIGGIADPDGERTKQVLGEYARKHSIHIVGGSVANLTDKGVLNTSYVFAPDGNVLAEYSKIHLFRLMDEHKYLAAGDRIGEMTLAGIPAGLLICYDIRFPELTRKLALGGAKILFVPAQWPNPRLHHWRSLLIARAIENQMYIVACNRVGTSGTSEFFGHSLIIDPWGEIISEGDDQERIITADVPLATVDDVRARIPVFSDRRPSLY